jgi:hypothetical protein
MHKINFGLIYYCSITPTCFGSSIKAIIREFKVLESYKGFCGDLLECCYVYVFVSRCDCCGMLSIPQQN